MRKYFLILIIFFISIPANSEVISGEVFKELRKNFNQVYDIDDNTPLSGAIVKIPSHQIKTRTKKDGTFELKTKIDAPTILSVEKHGYKPFSITIETTANNPLNIGIEKTNGIDIVLETEMIHIGDDSFSARSANANDFSLSSSGSFYTKEFNFKEFIPNKELFLVIGSIIGIDTIEAQRLGQSKVLTAYASPPEIFFNGSKISNIKINGDNQKIPIPKGLIKWNTANIVTIKAGHNLYKTAYIDYDDIEFTNLLFEFK